MALWGRRDCGFLREKAHNLLASDKMPVYNTFCGLTLHHSSAILQSDCKTAGTIKGFDSFFGLGEKAHNLLADDVAEDSGGSIDEVNYFNHVGEKRGQESFSFLVGQGA